MNRVKMLSTQLGSDDGYTVKTFASGQEYTITDKMLAAFISVGAVELVDDAPREDKAIHGAPERLTFNVSDNVFGIGEEMARKIVTEINKPKRGRPRRG